MKKIPALIFCQLAIIVSSQAFAQAKSSIRSSTSIDAQALPIMTPYRVNYGGRFNAMFNRSGINIGILNSAGLKLLPVDLPVNVEIIRGIAPVKNGLYGGPYSIQVELPQPLPYNPNDGDVDFKAGSMQSYFSSGDHYVGTYLAQWRNQNHVGQIVYADNNWNDIDLGDDLSLLNSQADKQALGGRYFYQGDKQNLTIVCGLNEQENVGQPADVMDILDGEATLCGVAYNLQLSPHTTSHFEIKYQDGDGFLSNFDLRDLSNTFAHRYTNIDSESLFAKLTFTSVLNNISYDYGVEWQNSEVNAVVTAGPEAIFDPITNPFSPFLEDFFIDDFRRAKILSAFLDTHWQYNGWQFNTGIRLMHSNTQGESLVDNVIGWHAPVIPNPNARHLRNVYDDYQNSDRDISDDLVDLVFSAAQQVNQQWKVTYSFAHHNLLADVTERALFIPNWPVGGVTDGHNYIGNPNLENSKALQFEINSEYRLSQGFWGARVFYDDIDDYIQGVSIKKHGIEVYSLNSVLALNGSGNYWDDENPLQFQNIDAKLWGIDLSGGYMITPNLHINGVAAYMRGKNDSHDDYLYRMLPPYINTELTYLFDRISFSYSLTAYAKQSFASRDNEPAIVGRNIDAETSGYAVHSIKMDWNVHPALQVKLGIENLFDRLYVDHLAPYNLIENSDIGLKKQIPGIGRNIYLSLNLRFD